MSRCPKCQHDRNTNLHRAACKGVPLPEKKQAEPSDEVLKMIKLAKSGISFEELCNKLDVSPKRGQQLLKFAAERNAPLNVEHNIISVAPSPALDHVQDILISKPRGGRYIMGALSDTHNGSKYCLRGAIRETVDWMYEQGARDITHSGDVLEGCYSHARYERSHEGFDAQLGDAAKCFPQHKGLRYHFVTGNHDFTFEHEIGMRIGIAIQDGMRARGRNDWLCYGDRNAFVKLGGLIVNLWHPGGSGAYARSYHLQKRIEGYAAIKPHVLLMGHYHQFCHVFERGIYAFGMPCFQGSGSNFAQSLKGPPSIGGFVFSWQLSETGRVYDLRFQERFFFERDDVFSPRNELLAEELPAVGRDHRYRARNERE